MYNFDENCGCCTNMETVSKIFLSIMTNKYVESDCILFQIFMALNLNIKLF